MGADLEWIWTGGACVYGVPGSREKVKNGTRTSTVDGPRGQL